MNWVRSADRRAKRAEAKLAELPNWQAKHHDMSQLYRSSLSALKRAEADANALEERARQYAEMNDKMVDAHTKQVAKIDGLIVHFKALAEAAIEHGKGLVELAHIQHRVAAADVALASLGATYTPHQASNT